ncbi:MAG: hypothetical protein ABI744_00455 [Chloroflexota bacterium]
MSHAHVHLTDDLLRSALADRATTPDALLLRDILRRTSVMDQPRARWRVLDRGTRRSTMVIAFLILGTAAAAFFAAHFQTAPPHNGEIATGGSNSCALTLTDPQTGGSRELGRAGSGCSKNYYLSYGNVIGTPDGATVLYAVSRICGGCSSGPSTEQLDATGIWAADVVTGAVHLIEKCDRGFCPDFSISGDGRLLVVARQGAGVEVVSLTGDPPRDIALAGTTSWAYEAAFSPDGMSIAVLALTSAPSVTGPRDSELQLIDLASGRATTVITGSGQQWAVAWSRDGTRLTFLSPLLDDPSAYATRVVLVDGTEVAPPTEAMPGVVFSPDGVHGAYAREPGPPPFTDYQIHVMRVDGTDDHVVLRQPECCLSGPQFSPDGQFVAFSILVGGNPDRSGLYLASIDGADLRRLSASDPGDQFTWLTQH